MRKRKRNGRMVEVKLKYPFNFSDLGGGGVVVFVVVVVVGGGGFGTN
jgi:hypothetical protein